MQVNVIENSSFDEEEKKIYGIEFKDKAGNIVKINNITTDIEFLYQIIKSITLSDYNINEVKNVIENLIVERYNYKNAKVS